MNCVNRKFIHHKPETAREELLKVLDHHIKIIPIISPEGQLLEVFSHDHFPLAPQYKIYARAKSPVRISFGGGGSDLTHYFINHDGAVINSTVAIYSHATLKKRCDSKIIIYSYDLKAELKGDCLEDILKQNGKFDLLVSLLRLIQPDYGFELYIDSEFPMRSGLGGSAVVLSAMIGCFNQFRQDRWDNYEMAEMAFQAERLSMGVAGGWQDQYATVFGGFNFIEFTAKQNVVHPLRIASDIVRELEESLIICDTGVAHESGNIHKDQKETMENMAVIKLVNENKELTFRIRNHLLRGQLLDFGKALHQSWMLKRNFSKYISNSDVDATYKLATENGAVGGKILGAGGGGFFLFYVTPFQKYNLLNALEETGLNIKQFTFDNEGLRAWTVREMNNFDV
jgi:D-glycero-alpha-D-manno-heptose-7-phosphate kinase